MKRILALAAFVTATLLASQASGQGFVDMRAPNSSQTSYPYYGAPYSNQNYSATAFYGLNNLRYGASFQGHRDFLEDSYTNNFITRFYRDTVGATDVTNGMSMPGPVRAFYNPGSMTSNGASVSTGPYYKPADPFGLLPSAFNSQAFISSTNNGHRITAPTSFYQGPAPTDAQGLPILNLTGTPGNQLSTNGLNLTQDQTGRIFAPALPLSVEPPSVFAPQITFYSATEAGMKPPANPTGRILPFTTGTAPSQEPEFQQNESEPSVPWALTPNGHGAEENQPGPTIPMPGYQTLPSAADQYLPDYLSQFLPPGSQRSGSQQPGRPAAGNPSGAQPQGPPAAPTSAQAPQAGPTKPTSVGEQYYQLALIDLHAGVYRQAAEAFDQVAQFDPTLKFQAERGQGLARLLSFDYHAAAHLLAKNLTDQPDATGVLFRVGSLVDRQQDWDAVDADLTAILRDSPTSAAHAFDLAYLRIFSGRPLGLDAYLFTAAKNSDLAPAVKILRARIQQ
jgi:hypothetical protein